MLAAIEGIAAVIKAGGIRQLVPNALVLNDFLYSDGFLTLPAKDCTKGKVGGLGSGRGEVLKYKHAVLREAVILVDTSLAIG